MRVAAALVFVAVALVAASALAGLGFAGTSPSAVQYEYGKTITICHRTSSKKHPWVDLKIDIHAWPAHLQHGDAFHPCTQAQLTPPKQYRDGKQVAICHRTKSKTHPWVDMKVNIRAWPGHLQHGDTFGACSQAQLNPPAPTPPGNDADHGRSHHHK